MRAGIEAQELDDAAKARVAAAKPLARATVVKPESSGHGRWRTCPRVRLARRATPSVAKGPKRNRGHAGARRPGVRRDNGAEPAKGGGSKKPNVRQGDGGAVAVLRPGRPHRTAPHRTYL